jgi:hypothetical protein
MTIKDIIEKKDELIAMKKAAIKIVNGNISSVIKSNSTIKGVYADNENDLERTIIGNTYLWMDSHEDVHAKGVFSKTIKERKNSIFHLHDHKFEITAKVGEPINIYENDILWADLGVNKIGYTQALFMDTKIMKSYNNQVFDLYKNGKINQHSVGMQYVKIDLAVNDENYEDEYKVWLDNIDSIGNKEKAQEKGYFWLVREAKLIEISAVLLGSNELTPTLENKNEPLKNTQNNEAVDKHFNLSEAIKKININI